MVERGHRDDPLECALEFSHVVGEAFGDEIEHVVRHANVVLLGEHAQNRDARLQIRRLDVHGDALLEAGDEAVLEILQIVRRHVGGDDDALVRLVEAVERVEELLENAAFAAEELDVVDEQHIHFAVLAVELLHGRVFVVLAGGADRLDEVVRELLARHIEHARAGLLVLHGVVAYGVQ